MKSFCSQKLRSIFILWSLALSQSPVMAITLWPRPLLPWLRD
uniref:Uncharacterized protein n=1 Tax=Anguilla anguilla TaxID=7936 RepID=A0A0E9Q5T2_ANGAN